MNKNGRNKSDFLNALLLVSLVASIGKCASGGNEPDEISPRDRNAAAARLVVEQAIETLVSTNAVAITFNVRAEAGKISKAECDLVEALEEGATNSTHTAQNEAQAMVKSGLIGEKENQSYAVRIDTTYGAIRHRIGSIRNLCGSLFPAPQADTEKTVTDWRMQLMLDEFQQRGMDMR